MEKEDDEDMIKEEEELQLALALSVSEAEEKEKAKLKSTGQILASAGSNKEGNSSNSSVKNPDKKVSSCFSASNKELC